MPGVIIKKFNKSMLRRYKKKTPKTMTRTNLTNFVKKVALRQSETKKFEYTVNERQLTTLTSPTVVDQLTVVPQGNGYQQRVGHEILTTGFSIRGFVNTVAPVQQFIRIMVLVRNDAQSNPIDDVLEDNTGNHSAATSGDVLKILRRVNTDKYKVLTDRVMKFGDGRAQQMYDDTKLFKIWIPYRKKLRFDAAQSVPPTDEVFLLAWTSRSDADTTTGTRCELSFSSTLYYKDP